MRTAIASLALLTIACGGTAAANSELPIERPANRFAADLLDAHNSERKSFGAPPLQWSPKLA